MQPRFLILRGGAIGDLILTLPVLQAIRDQWPDAHIELVGYPRTNELVQAAGLADETHSLDAARIALLYVEEAELPLDMARWLAAFTSVIHFLSDANGLVTDNLKARCKHVIGQTPMPPEGTHATDHYLFALQEIGVFEAGRHPQLGLADPAFANNGKVAIHAGSGGAHKNWPLDRYLELSGNLDKVVWVLGEADEEISRALPAEAERWENLPLHELASRLAGCRLFLGNDSGIAHLAAAVGVSSVVLFGPSDSASWAPRGAAEVKIVQAASGFIGDLLIEQVQEALQDMESSL